MQPTPLSPPRDPWLWLFLVRLPAIGQLAEGNISKQERFHTQVRYGNSSISWQRILEPSIKMAREGITVSNTLAGAIADKNWFGQKLTSPNSKSLTETKGWTQL